jgi:hypothetical protein
MTVLKRPISDWTVEILAAIDYDNMNGALGRPTGRVPKSCVGDRVRSFLLSTMKFN